MIHINTYIKLLRFFCIWRSSTFWGIMRHQKDQRNCQDKSCMEKRKQWGYMGIPSLKGTAKAPKTFSDPRLSGSMAVSFEGIDSFACIANAQLQTGISITNNRRPLEVRGWWLVEQLVSQNADIWWFVSRKFHPLISGTNSDLPQIRNSDRIQKTLQSSPMTSKTSPVRFGVLGTLPKLI